MTEPKTAREFTSAGCRVASGQSWQPGAHQHYGIAPEGDRAPYSLFITRQAGPIIRHCEPSQKNMWYFVP